METNIEYVSNVNSYSGNVPQYIVVHNTDNYAATADAKRHAMAQFNGNFKGYSAHEFVDDHSDYQAMPYNRGAYHVGVNYGGKLFGTVNNRNSVGVEMCVNEGSNYEKAFQNTVQVVKNLMVMLKIPADRVVSHYDVCGKNCPSEIRKKADWNRFKRLISDQKVESAEVEVKPVIDKLYRVRKTWLDSASQIGAYKDLENAKAAADKHPDYVVYDWNGNSIYISRNYLVYGDTGKEVEEMQKMLSYCGYSLGTVDGDFGGKTEKALEAFQSENDLEPDKKYGDKSKEALTKLYKIIEAYNKRIS